MSEANQEFDKTLDHLRELADTQQKLLLTLDKLNNCKGCTGTTPLKIHQNVVALENACYWMRQYIEPWICTECGASTKVPYNKRKPRWCAQCESKNSMFPYAYTEQTRMSNQIKLLLNCAQYYAKRNGGEVAQGALRKIHAPETLKKGLQPEK